MAYTKQDPNTGLFIITNSSGETFRVGADTQSQLDAYINSVDTGKPVTIPSTNPLTGEIKNVTFNPAAITAQKNSIAQDQALLTQTKRTTGIIGNADGTYSNLRTGETLTQEQAAAAIQKAGLPPQALASITPKNSPTYSAATAAADNTTNTPSNLPASPAVGSTQPNPAISTDNTTISSTTDPANINIEQQAATSDNFADKQTVTDEPNIEQQAATSDNFADKKVVDQEPNTEQQAATSDNFADKKVVDQEPNTEQQAATSNNFDDKKIAEDPAPTGSARGLSGAIQRTRASKTTQDQTGFNSREDWRVRLSLAPATANNVRYLYNLDNPGILAPLKATDGIIFPYTPTISVAYTANYDPQELTHSNYKIFQYRSSSVDSVNITAWFTAQDTYEANYLLATIHFLRSLTKMFYGQDINPLLGTPPPLCFLSGMGDYQFNEHPMVINNFTYTLPSDVDYIRANSVFDRAPASSANGANTAANPLSQDPMQRLQNVQPGGMPMSTNWSNLNNDKTNPPTYVPTKIQFTINAYPIVSRNAISNKFSLEKYGTGELLLGNKNGSEGMFGGIW